MLWKKEGIPMNRLHLERILSRYAERFSGLSDEEIRAEAGRWLAVRCFQRTWDIKAENFQEMYLAASSKMDLVADRMLVTQSDNIAYLLAQGETDFVRDQFERLFSDDEGDLERRKQRAAAFAQAVNAKVTACAGSLKYAMKMGHGLVYLNMWRPAENYIYKSTDASSWANCVEFAEDFGGGRTFSLVRFYRLCDELRREISIDERFKAINEKIRRVTDFDCDDQMHLLVYDIMFRAQAGHFYKNAGIGKMTVKVRLKKAAAQERIDSLELLIAGKRHQMEKMGDQETGVSLDGAAVLHKKYGKGIVEEVADDRIAIRFNEEVKKFKYPHAFDGGILTLEASEHMDVFRSNGEMAKVKDQLMKEIRTLSGELEALKNEISV